MTTFSFLADIPEAIPIVARWYFDEWGHKQPDNSFEKTCERIRTKLNRDKLPLHLIAVESNSILGVAQLKIREMDIYPDKEHWLGSVYIASEHRGRGLASQLCAKAIEVARSFEIEKLFLQTEKLDGGLYKILGWQPLEIVNYHGLDVLVMERSVRA